QERRKAEPGYNMCKEVVTMLGVSSRRIQDRVKEISDCVKGLSTEPQFAPCQMVSVVKDVFEALSWIADQKSLSLKSEGLEDLPEIVADERRLFNAFYNLINNAIPEVSSGGSISIYGKEQPPGVGILISVADTGKGMSPEVRDSLFTARAQSRKAGGTGLGTKIVKDVIDAHRGRISVESEVGRGTTFYIHLPLSPPTA
ncbi:MAG: HAMP domain-containing sensor histidine kinase, partial [Vicinamibacteria bacterium]